MKAKDCRDCKWVSWMVGIGLGVRCNHPTNNADNSPGLPILISQIPEGCEYKQTQDPICHNSNDDY
jgi:hypothetical protein